MDSVKTQLENDGYAIIPNLLDHQECVALHRGVWDFWEARGIKRTDTTTWKDIHKYFPTKGMLIQYWSVGQMQPIWDLRSNPKVTGVFESIWGTTNLTCSFDGMAMGLAPEITNRGWDHKQKGWLHLDQSPTRNGFECVQGWVTPCRVEEGDASLTVLRGSHKLHGEFAEAFNLKVRPEDDAKVRAKKRADWYALTPEQVQWYKDKCQQVTITCPKGSMVLWESRTVHAGKGPVQGRARPKNRMVAYISMMPDDLTPRQRKTKQKAIIEGRMTTHWASQRVKLFGRVPQTRGQPLPEVPEYELPLLTARGAKLAGFDAECPLTIADPAARKAAAQAWLAKLGSAKRKSSGGAAKPKKPKITDFPLIGNVENAVITFAGSIESDRTGATHGTKRRGFNRADLVNIGKTLGHSTLYTVGSTGIQGHVLIVKGFGNPNIFNEICQTPKDYIDRHMWSYGKLKNKNARWNTNYADIEQKGDITNPDPAKRVPSLIPFTKVPHIAAVREQLSNLPGVDTRNLYGEVNIYRKSKTIQGIGEHMDKEREMVIGLSVGTMPRFICFQAYQGMQPIGPKLKIRIDPGDLYFMDVIGKGTGSVMKPHIRHHATGGTGSERYLKKVVSDKRRKLIAKGGTLNKYSQAIVDGNELFTDGNPIII